MILGCFLLGAAAFGFIAIDGAGVLAAALRGVQGIAWSLTFAAGMSLVAEVAPPVRLGHGIGLYGAVALATSALGPAVAEPIAARFGARPLFLLSAVVGLAGAWFVAGCQGLFKRCDTFQGFTTRQRRGDLHCSLCGFVAYSAIIKRFINHRQ